MTTQPGWWKRVFSSTDPALQAELTRLGEDLLAREKLVEELQASLQRATEQAAAQRQARADAERAAALAEQTLRGRSGEQALMRNSLERYRARALRAEGALKHSEAERVRLQAERGELQIENAALQGRAAAAAAAPEQLSALQLRAETAESEAAAVKQHIASLLEELAELRSELEHAHAESVRAGARPSLRLREAAAGEASPPSHPPGSSREQLRHLADALRCCVIGAARALDAALGSRSPLATAMGFEDPSVLRGVLGASQSFEEAAARVQEHLARLGLLHSLQLRQHGGGLSMDIEIHPHFDPADGLVLARWLSVYVICGVNATAGRDYRLRQLDGGPQRFTVLALSPDGAAPTNEAETARADAAAAV